MAVKTINDNPSNTDTILFELTCTDASGCTPVDPYKFISVSIYYVERGYTTRNFGEYLKVIGNSEMAANYNTAKIAACDNPTTENIVRAQSLKTQMESAQQVFATYYHDRHPIKVWGQEFDPVWFPEDPENPTIDSDSPLTRVSPGQFQLEWSPQGAVREGDYFICWSWAPIPAGDILSAHWSFSLTGNPAAVLTIPSHIIKSQKYETLLERYLPEMYKTTISNNDVTPDTLFMLNQALALGFTDIENLANQLIDLFDANALNETLLMYLSNLFNLKLKSGDGTLWRRQIKEAIPLYKQKGSRPGLERALLQAGMKLNKLTRLWQVVSRYTWQESFRVSDKTTFKLKFPPIQPFTDDNFKIWIRPAQSSDYLQLPQQAVSVTELYDVATMAWQGDQLSTPINLQVGDILRVQYQFREYPSESDRQIESYMLALPLADQRDEAAQEFPPKNWNVHVIEEDDPIFDIIVPIRHPFQDWLVFGQIRTEFPYSENVYNMEEYNGSTRDSYDACYIDKNFIDPCGACISSKYNIDVGLEDLSDDRVSELRQILKEFTPFHSVVHSINLQGEVLDFVAAPEESIDKLVTFSKQQFVISNSNPFFHRALNSYEASVLRNSLASSTQVVPSLQKFTFSDSSQPLSTLNVTAGDWIQFASNSHWYFVLSMESADVAVLRDDGTLSHNPDAASYTVYNPGENPIGTGTNGSLTITPTALADPTATAYSRSICFITPDQNLLDLGVDTNYHLLEILAPSSNYGVYSLRNFQGNIAEIATDQSTVVEPLNTSAFTFNLSNVIARKSWVNISQHNQYRFQDPVHNLSEWGIATGWKIRIDGYNTYVVLEVLPNGIVILENDGTLTSDAENLGYEILRPDDTSVFTGGNGALTVNWQALADLSDPTLIQKVITHGEFLRYDGADYNIIGFEDNKLILEDYQEGDANGVDVVILKRLVSEGIGYFNYRGTEILTSDNYELILGIQNGMNAPSLEEAPDDCRFKENFLVCIDGTNYRIDEIDGQKITISGDYPEWPTYSAGGELVSFKIFRYDSRGPNGTGVDVGIMAFQNIHRDAGDVVERDIVYDNRTEIIMLSTEQPTSPTENISQGEGVKLKIEYKNGDTREVDL